MAAIFGELGGSPCRHSGRSWQLLFTGAVQTHPQTCDTVTWVPLLVCLKGLMSHTQAADSPTRQCLWRQHESAAPCRPRRCAAKKTHVFKHAFENTTGCWTERVNRRSPSCNYRYPGLHTASRGKHTAGPQYQVSTDNDTENPESLFTNTQNCKPF